jgi:hypothetical protein
MSCGEYSVQPILDIFKGYHRMGWSEGRFADGWKIFLFEAQNIIRKNLEERLSSATGSALITDHTSPDAPHSQIVHLQHLLEISRSKCEVQTRQIMEIVKRHVGSRWVEFPRSSFCTASMALLRGDLSW